MEVLDEVLQQVDPFLDLDLVDFKEILWTHRSVRIKQEENQVTDFSK